MPITIKTAAHEASLINSDNKATNVMEILTGTQSSNRSKADTPKEIIQSSFKESEISALLQPNKNGFVHSVTQAYNNHHHLIIRPDDVWIAIITQFSYFVNANAEELRSHFVAHEGQKELKVVYPSGTRYTVDFGQFAQIIAGLIEQNIKDPELRQWILPQFTTTTEQDEIIASIVMMGTLQAYFKYSAMIMCGIPSVTLLGEKEDYQLMLSRVDKLSQYGEEPTAWADLLRSTLTGFVRTFEEPDAQEVQDFWKGICDYRGGSGISRYSGWITHFCFWTSMGKRQVRPGGRGVDSKDIPSGFTKVPVLIDDNGVEIHAEMLAGSVGIDCTSSGKPVHAGRYSKETVDKGPDTVQPVLGWFIYEK